MNVYSNILDMVGQTPMLEVTRIDTGPCRLFLKLELMNPGGSIKDRIGVSMIEEAEKRAIELDAQAQRLTHLRQWLAVPRMPQWPASQAGTGAHSSTSALTYSSIVGNDSSNGASTPSGNQMKCPMPIDGKSSPSFQCTR